MLKLRQLQAHLADKAKKRNLISEGIESSGPQWHTLAQEDRQDQYRREQQRSFKTAHTELEPELESAPEPEPEQLPSLK